MQPGYTMAGAASWKGGERGMMWPGGGGAPAARRSGLGLGRRCVVGAVVVNCEWRRRYTTLQTCLTYVQVASCMHFWSLRAAAAAAVGGKMGGWVGGDLAMRLLFCPPRCAARRNTSCTVPGTARVWVGAVRNGHGHPIAVVAGWFGALEVG